MIRILTLIMALGAALGLRAINNPIATLTHGDEIKHFTTINALIMALDAAEDGDQISLSVGTFDCVLIDKYVTICGAGMGTISGDSIDSTNATKIKAGVSVVLPEPAQGENKRLVMEDISFPDYVHVGDSYNNVLFNRCYFHSELNSTYDNNDINASFFNCCVESYQFGPNEGLAFSHCLVNVPVLTEAFYFENCIITITDDAFGNTMGLGNTTMKNCIFINTAAISQVHDNMDLENTLVISTQPVDMDTSTITGQLYEADSTDGLFKEGTYYELTDEAAAKYLGSDGTQVGLYGGASPFQAELNNPRITSLTTAEYPDSNRQLSVTLEIK